MLRSFACSVLGRRLLRLALLACAAAGLTLPATSSADFVKPFDSAATRRHTAAPARWLPAGFTDTTVWSGLNFPTTIDEAADGRVFLAQQIRFPNMFDCHLD